MPAPSASPRTLGTLCFVASALVLGGGWWGVPAGASATLGAQSTTTVPAAGEPSTSEATVSSSVADGTGSTSEPAVTDAPIDVLRADAAEVEAELAATSARRAEAEARLAAARTAAAEADAAVGRAETAERAAADAAAALDRRVKAAAVDAFIGSGRDVPLGVLATDDVREASWEATVLQYRTEQLDALLGEQRDAHDRLDLERQNRSAAAEAATEAAARAGDDVDALVRLESDQVTLVAQVEHRLDSALAEAAALAAIDQAAADALAQQEQGLATAAALSVASAPPPVSTPPSSGPSAVPVVAPPSTSPRSTPRPSVTAVPTTTPSAPVSPGTTVPTTVPRPVSVDTVNVGGFVVARSIADPLTRLLAAAQAAGLSFGGSGYRDINVQISLRRSHCGTTDYDIWQRPASQCSPPTAIPGRSMHEKGLALDFTCSGVLISSRSNPCFVWLAANASSYGLYNLPSEPWHWSTNGN